MTLLKPSKFLPIHAFCIAVVSPKGYSSKLLRAAQCALSKHAVATMYLNEPNPQCQGSGLEKVPSGRQEHLRWSRQLVNLYLSLPRQVLSHLELIEVRRENEEKQAGVKEAPVRANLLRSPCLRECVTGQVHVDGSSILMPHIFRCIDSLIRIGRDRDQILTSPCSSSFVNRGSNENETRLNSTLRQTPAGYRTNEFCSRTYIHPTLKLCEVEINAG